MFANCLFCFQNRAVTEAVKNCQKILFSLHTGKCSSSKILSVFLSTLHSRWLVMSTSYGNSSVFLNRVAIFDLKPKVVGNLLPQAVSLQLLYKAGSFWHHAAICFILTTSPCLQAVLPAALLLNGAFGLFSCQLHVHGVNNFTS